MADRGRLRSLVILALLAAALTLVLQKWVGDVTLYRPALAEKKLVLHEAVLHNDLPPGETWTSLGANGSNTRVGVVYLASGLHDLTGIRVLTIYRGIDTVALFASLLLLFAYLRLTASPPYALAGMLYFACVLPLTYFFAYFHPWDRVSLMLWIALLILLRAQRLVAFTGLLALSVAVKYDTVLLPGLYFLAEATRRTWRLAAVRTLSMFAVSLGVLIALLVLFPGGNEARSIGGYVSGNLDDLRSHATAYPPLLVFAVPAALAAIGWRGSDRFARASVAFAAGLAVVLFCVTKFVEVRTQMPILVLLLPSALAGARALLEDTRGGACSPIPSGSGTGPGPGRRT